MNKNKIIFIFALFFLLGVIVISIFDNDISNAWDKVKAEADAAFLKQNYDVSGVLYEKAIDLGYDFTTPSAVCDSMSNSAINSCIYYYNLVTEKSIEKVSYPQITDHIWIVNNENISPLCMEFIWMSGDNYEEYEEKYPQAKNFTSYPGQYWGNIIPLDPLNASWGESLSIPKPLKKCNKTKPNDLISIENNVFSHSEPIDSITQITTKYTLLAEWGSNGCSKVIPQFADQCQSLVFVNIEDTSSRISQGGFNSYAHIIVKDKAYIVPVTNGMPLEDLLKLIESN
jgi:hypothetical protein